MFDVAGGFGAGALAVVAVVWLLRRHRLRRGGRFRLTLTVERDHTDTAE